MQFLNQHEENYYKKKYYKYKIKYKMSKESKLGFLYGGVSAQAEITMYLQKFIDTYFKTFNVISWTENKTYLVRENDESLRDFCLVQTDLESCDNLISQEINIMKPFNKNYCCEFTYRNANSINTSKRSVLKFQYGNYIEKDDIKLTYIGSFDQIGTCKGLCPEEKSRLMHDLELKKQMKIGRFKQILINKINEDKKLNQDEKLKNIKCINDITNEEHMYEECVSNIYDNYFEYDMTDEKYKGIISDIKLLNKIIDIKDNAIPVKLQNYTNKIFMSEKDGKQTYYIYFSYGTLKDIENVDWSFSLSECLSFILSIVENSNVENIILAGHSFGSIAIQKLALMLIEQIPQQLLEKIYVIGSGCRYKNSITDSELLLFKQSFNNRHFFVITNYIDNNGQKNFDTINTDEAERKKIHKITTHFLTVSGTANVETINNYAHIINESILQQIDYNEINNPANNYRGVTNPTLHDFKTYQLFYLIKI